MQIDLNPTVCLDGTAIRRIREEKKLTQFYVAKVVGVTTDTVSRWENNRYPSIKRDNALRLAEALEVRLEEVLQKPAEEPVALPQASFRPKRPVVPIVAGLALLLLAAGFWLFRLPGGPPTGLRAERLLPVYAAPGTVVPVRVRLSVEDGMKGVILREHFPPGWKLIEASPPASSLDNEEGTARWILKSGEARQVVSYLVRVAPGAKMGLAGNFQGDLVANREGRNRPVPVVGAERVRVAAHLWADMNGDNVVDDGEMLLASDLFDEMTGVHLDWKQLETIWDAGSYRWLEERQQFVPARTPPP